MPKQAKERPRIPFQTQINEQLERNDYSMLEENIQRWLDIGFEGMTPEEFRESIKPGQLVKYLGKDKNGDIRFRSGGFVSYIDQEEGYFVLSAPPIRFSLRFDILTRVWVNKNPRKKKSKE